MKRSSQQPPPAPPSALQTVGALGRELARLSRQLETTVAEIERTDEPSRRFALEKLNQQRSVNFARLSKQAIAAERELKLLLERSDVEATWGRVLREWRSALESLPRRVATNSLFAGLNPVDVEQLLIKECDATLDLLFNQDLDRPLNGK